jgi:hypothetical protein
MSGPERAERPPRSEDPRPAESGQPSPEEVELMGLGTMVAVISKMSAEERLHALDYLGARYGDRVRDFADSPARIGELVDEERASELSNLIAGARLREVRFGSFALARIILAARLPEGRRCAVSNDRIDLAAIRARLAEASPGPWRAHDTWLDSGGHTATVLRGPEGEPCIDGVAWLPTRRSDVYWDDQRNVWADAQFIAAARQDVPALLAEVERLRNIEDAIRGESRHSRPGNKIVQP